MLDSVIHEHATRMLSRIRFRQDCLGRRTVRYASWCPKNMFNPTPAFHKLPNCLYTMHHFFVLYRCCRLRPMHCCEMPVQSVNYKPTLCCDLRSMCNGAQCRSLITGRHGHGAADHHVVHARERSAAARHRHPHVHDMHAPRARHAYGDEAPWSRHGCGCG